MAFSNPVQGAERLPVTVLTGSLSASKTTVLNWSLSRGRGLMAAVIERLDVIHPMARLGTSHNAKVPPQELLGAEVFEPDGCPRNSAAPKS